MADPSKSPLWRNLLLILVLVAIVVMRLFPAHPTGSVAGRSGANAPSSGAPGAAASAHPGGTNERSTSPVPSERAFGAGVGFRSHDRLQEHFAKHGGEFASLGIHDEAAYLRAAQTLRDGPAGGDVLEIVRAADGVISRFDRRTGAFLAFGDDGVIRTFFRPRDGERYFERQSERAPEGH